MKLVLAIAIAGACGKPAAPPTGCKVDWTGNFAESAQSLKDCPTLAAGVGATAGDTLLQLAIPSRALHGDFAITLDLGRTPTAGTYNSGTTDLWSAAGTKRVAPGGACVFLAGNNTTPTGDFMLELSAIDRTTLHGTLAVRMFVLPRASDDGKQTDCGPGTTEQLQVRF
jgi:hypothetical protein